MLHHRTGVGVQVQIYHLFEIQVMRRGQSSASMLITENLVVFKSRAALETIIPFLMPLIGLADTMMHFIATV
jgi:hypothetical protein